MRALCFACALWLASSSAMAQVVGIETQCVGIGAPSVDFGMVIDNGTDEVTNIGTLAAGGVINQAECACNSHDLFLQGLVLRPLPDGSQPAFSVWEGAGCNAVTARSTTGNVCEQVRATVSPMSFWNGGSSARPQQGIDVRALIAPLGASSPSNPLPHSCPEGGVNISNAVWMLFGDPNRPDYCSVVVPANTIPPSAPQDFTAGSGDSAVVLKWNAPPTGTARPPAAYQVLCADVDGNPLAGQGAYDMTDFIREEHLDLHLLQYSTCTADGLQRRVLATGSPTLAPPVDAGVAPPQLLSANSDPPLDEEFSALATDAQTVAGASALNSLDKKFVCSDPIARIGTRYSKRIDGLTNGVAYQFMVVGIDDSGNTMPTPVLIATPRPTQDLYQRFLAEGGRPQGFCFIATAAFGSYQSPYVKVLRDFRDQALLPHAWGRAFVAWYYHASPPCAAYIAARPVARWLVRQALWPVIAAAALWLWLAWWQQVLLAVGCALAWRRLRRRASTPMTRRALAAAAALAALAYAPPVAARYDWGDKPPRPPKTTRFLAELKFGTYSPNIDATSGLRGTPFSDLFTNQYQFPAGRRPAGKLLTTIEFDWQFLHGFGSLGLAASVAFQRRGTHAFEVSQDTTNSRAGCVVFNRDPSGTGCIRSSDQTYLSFIPMSLMLVYRFDVLALRYKVPLVPYMKAGFTWYLWWIEHNSGDLSRALTPEGKSTGIGSTAGLIAQPGLALALDMLDPTSARTLDADVGIHHSYVFAELNYAWVTGLGFKNKMVFSDLSWNVGIAFEF